MASGRAAMPTAVAASRGGVRSSMRSGGSAGKIETSIGNRCNQQLRAQLRAKSVRPVRYARGGVMPAEAKHSAVPEAQVRAAATHASLRTKS